MKHARRTPNQYPKWSATDDDLARRFAAALVAGRYANALAAARACRDAFRHKKGRTMGHHLEGVHFRIGHYARLLGRPPTRAPWTGQELQILERFSRAIVQGRYRSVRVAAPECRRAMNELAARRRARSGRRVIRRSLEAIRGKLFLRVKALFGPRFGAYWTPAEDRIVDHYARALVAGQFPTATAAGRACWQELSDYARGQRLKSPANFSSTNPRSLAASNLHMRQRAYELGWTCFRRHPWSDKEHEIALKWTRLYRDHLKADVPYALGNDGRALRAELKKHGLRRTLDQCKTRLWKTVHHPPLTGRTSR